MQKELIYSKKGGMNDRWQNYYNRHVKCIFWKYNLYYYFIINKAFWWKY